MVYLKGDYARALGICQAALAFNSESYLIPMIYIYCMIATCHINLKNTDGAKSALLKAWERARKDELLEPFIEHHGLLQGLLESSVKKEFSEVYKRLNKAAIAFSRGWVAIHNPRTGNDVTAELTTMEFSIAMLASRGWSNQEIAEYLKLSVNTIKQYLSTIYMKLNINKRGELKQYLLT